MIAIEISSAGATRVVPWGDGDTTPIRSARGTKRDIPASFLRFAWFTMAPATEAMCAYRDGEMQVQPQRGKLC